MSSKKRHKHGFGNRREHIETNEESPLFDEFDRMRTCSSKNGYDSEWQAQFVIDESREKYGTELTSYLCPYCNRWHLTEN